MRCAGKKIKREFMFFGLDLKNEFRKDFFFAASASELNIGALLNLIM